MHRALALLMVLALAPAPAAAHGVLDRTEPRAGAAVKASPSQIRLWFTGALEPAYSRVQVLDTAGKRMDLGDATVDPANRALLDRALRILRREARALDNAGSAVKITSSR